MSKEELDFRKQITCMRRLMLAAIVVMSIGFFVMPTSNKIATAISLYLSLGSYISLGKSIRGEKACVEDIALWPRGVFKYLKEKIK